ncbi:MAG: ABC transporter substrate-binding protein [Candidatus Rifleibacteriota bacterium]
MKSRFFPVFALFLCLAIFFTGCQRKEKLPQDVADILNGGKPGWLKLGIYGDPLSLNPVAHIESEHGQMVCNFVHASPLRKLQDGTFAPYLFDSYSLYPGSSGTVIMEAVWKNNLKWHDDVDFDPRDLEFTFDLMRKPENNSPYLDLLKGIKEIKSFGRGLRTRIVFAYDSRKLLDLLTIGIVPSHIIKDQKLDEARVPAAGTASDSWPLYIDQPVGLGPFKIKSRSKGIYIELVPYEKFFDNATRSSVLVKSYFDYQQLVSDFRSGRLDWINLPSMLAEQLKNMNPDGTSFIHYPNPAVLVWLFNSRNEFLKSVEVRNALNLIADRKKIGVEMPFAGKPVYKIPLAVPLEETYDENQRFAKALDLLDAAGWKDSNGDGIRDKDGKNLEIRLAFNEDNLLRRSLAEKLIEQCRLAGIKLIVEPVSWAELVANKLKTGEFDTALLSIKLPEFGNMDSFFHSKAIINGESAARDFVAEPLNYSGISNPELDQLLEQLDSMLPIENPEQKKAEVARLIEELQPCAFLFKPYDVGLFHAESAVSLAAAPVWNDVFNWKLLFGPADSKL